MHGSSTGRSSGRVPRRCSAARQAAVLQPYPRCSRLITADDWLHSQPQSVGRHTPVSSTRMRNHSTRSRCTSNRPAPLPSRLRQHLPQLDRRARASRSAQLASMYQYCALFIDRLSTLQYGRPGRTKHLRESGRGHRRMCANFSTYQRWSHTRSHTSMRTMARR